MAVTVDSLNSKLTTLEEAIASLKVLIDGLASKAQYNASVLQLEQNDVDLGARLDAAESSIKTLQDILAAE